MAPPSNLISLFFPPSSPIFRYTLNELPVQQNASSVPIQPSRRQETDDQTTSQDSPSDLPVHSAGWRGVQQGRANVKELMGTTGQIHVLPIPLNSFAPIYSNSTPHQVFLSAIRQTSYPWTSGANYTQDFGPSWVSMDVQCPSGTCSSDAPFTFSGANLTTEAGPPQTQLQHVVADDADHVIVYTGFAPVGTNNSVVSLRGDYKGTLSMTGTANATVAFRFRGTAVMLKGVTAPSLGSFSLTIDSTPQTTLSVRDNVATHNVPLFFTTALDDQIVHEVRVTTVGADAGRGPDIGLVLDRVDIWGPAGQTGFMWVHDIGQAADGTLVVPGNTDLADLPINYPPAEGGGGGGGGANAGVIVGAVLGTLAAIAIMWWLVGRYSTQAAAKKETKKLNPWDEANLLQNAKNEGVYITTAAKQRYVYPGMIAHSELKK